VRGRLVVADQVVVAVDAVLDGRLSIDEAMEALLARPFKAEN